MNIHTSTLKLGSTEQVRKKRAQGKPELTRQRLKELLNYNPRTGKWRWRVSRGGRKLRKYAGTIGNGYRLIFVDYWAYRSSRLAWLYQTGEWPSKGKYIDHINGKRADDSWSNLRLATPTENARNKGICPRNTSGKVGVCIGNKPGTWNANITIDDKTRSLGNFECKEDAIAARCDAEKHYFGEFARRVSNGKS